MTEAASEDGEPPFLDAEPVPVVPMSRSAASTGPEARRRERSMWLSFHLWLTVMLERTWTQSRAAL